MHRAGIKPINMTMTVLPVIPQDLRPMVQLTGGRFATSDLNDLISSCYQQKQSSKETDRPKRTRGNRRNEQRMLQEAVDALIDNSAARGNVQLTQLVAVAS